ncbi:MAG: chorismate--pyruvate lyase family protein [Cellvibrionaceae bacterium]
MSRKQTKVDAITSASTKRQWFPASALTLKHHSPLLKWLQDPGSLTTALQRHSGGDFSVRVLDQYWGRADFSEAQALGIDYRAEVLVREVVLSGRGQAWVWARSILPRQSLTGRLRKLRKLSNQPLGGWLFKQPNLQRDPLEISGFKPCDPRLPDEIDTDRALWGRRSVFYVDQKRILVAEVFLPEFLATLT